MDDGKDGVEDGEEGGNEEGVEDGGQDIEKVDDQEGGKFVRQEGFRKLVRGGQDGGHRGFRNMVRLVIRMAGSMLVVRWNY